jgi:general secretion pathway protein F
MPLYAYKGIAASGKTTHGVRDAESPKALRQLLRKDGVVVTAVDLSKGGAKARSGSGLSKEVDFGTLFQRVKKTEVAGFTRQLATLLRAGIPLAESLGALFDQAENPKLKGVLGEIKGAVNEGASLADAMAKHPIVFDDLFVSMVRAGEAAGNLDEVLSRLADFLESAGKLRSKVTGALVYPAIMVVVGIGIMALLMIAVVPKVTKMFAQQGKTLPPNTRLLMWMADTTASYWWLLIILAVGAGFVFRAWSRTPAGRTRWHGMVLKAPVFGNLLHFVAVARFCRTLGTMLEAGVPMLRALDTSKEVLGNAVLVKTIDDAKEGVTQGESLAVMLKRSGRFPASVTHMVAVGERSGTIEQMLTRIADAFEADVEARLGKMTSMLEPMMLVGMGIGVGFVVMSILQPLMSMSAH